MCSKRRRFSGDAPAAGRLGVAARGRPASGWVVTKLDPLRIVSDDLWANAHESLRDEGKVLLSSAPLPRLAGSRDSKYLLSDSSAAVCAAVARCSPGRRSIVVSPAGTPGVRGACGMHQHAHRAPGPRGPGRSCAVERDVLTRRWSGLACLRRSTQLTRADTGSAARREDLRTELARSSRARRYAPSIAAAARSQHDPPGHQGPREPADAIPQHLKVFALQDRRPRRRRSATLQCYLREWTAMTDGGVVEASVVREVLSPHCVSAGLRDRTTAAVKGPGRRAKLVYELAASIALQTFRGVNFCKLDGVPNGHDQTYEFKRVISCALIIGSLAPSGRPTGP